MDQKEAIKKLEAYIKALKEIDQTKENIREMKRRIDMTPVAPVRKYMLGRFLWPFLVGATIVLLVLCSVGDAIFAANPDSDMEMLFIFGLTGVYIAISIVIAKIIQNKKNKTFVDEQKIIRDDERARWEKLLKQYEDTLEKQEAVIEDMELYLPGVCRNAESASVIKNAIRLGRAQTIEEAVKITLEG